MAAADIFITWFWPTMANLAYEHVASIADIVVLHIAIVLHTQEVYNYKNVKPL
jgi:hypothetical protein